MKIIIIYLDINTMKNAAEKYYTKDRLPATVGDSTSMTLKEMIDNKMIIRFTDKDKNYCDESSSKVQVTKTADSEYVLKVELNCGEQRDYILETLGDNGLCSGSTCSSSTNSKDSVATNTNSSSNKNVNSSVDDDEDYSQYSDVKSADLGIKKTTVTYYQHKKAIYSTKTVYTCPEGYTKNGTKCIKSTTGATIDATPSYGADETIIKDAKYNNSGTIYADPIKSEADTTYTCPEGYTKNGAYCIKYTDAIEKNGDTTYICPEGYTKNGTKCVKSYTATYKEGATSYTCPNGGKLDGKNCVITSEATSNPSYTCPAGYTKNGSSCYKVYDATASTSYTCPAGYTKNGSKCYKSTTSSYNASVSKTYSCPKGGSLSGSKCVKTSSTSYNATPKNHYSCPKGGTLSGTKCVKTSTSTINATPNTTYSCPKGGTLNGSKCTITTNPSSTPSYSCPSGYTLSGKECKKTYEATVSNGSGAYTCPDGGTLSDKTCTITKDATGTPGEKGYTCPEGYTLNSSTKKCEKKIDANKNVNYTYTCPEGYTKSGEGENTKCSKESSNIYYCEDANATLNGDKCTIIKKGEIIGYTCPEGYTKSDNKCIKQTTETIDANIDKQTTVSYKYTWSKQSYLEGWTFTGKTKVVSENYTAGQK